MLPVLGAFLSIAVFGPFVLMFAGPVLLGDPEAAQIGLYLLLNVNPVAIPALIFLLGVAWAFRSWATSRVPAAPGAPPTPAPAERACRPAPVPPQRRRTDDRDVVIDVVARPAVARPGICGDHRASISDARGPALPFRPAQARLAGPSRGG
jgi:hypothetical protein